MQNFFSLFEKANVNFQKSKIRSFEIILENGSVEQASVSKTQEMLGNNSSSKRPQIGIILLVYELMSSIGLTRIPPVTLLTIAFQTALFLGAFKSYFDWPLDHICLSAQSVLEENQWQRIIVAPLFHTSDLHLYYNMMSLAWKGVNLERRYGSLAFLAILILMIGLTGLVYVGLCATIAKNLKDLSYLRQCAVGFSGVLFAMKVLSNDITDGNFGLFSIPKNLALWAELLIIQILVPNASLIGHLSGIISGMLITYFIPFTFKIMVMLPYKLTRHYPLTIIIASGLVGLHFDMFDKPWSTKWFWSSGPSLVCINHHYVYNKLDFKRLLSGPLEHSSNVHFFICLTSLVFKLSMLEKTYGVIKTLALSLISFFGTSVNYVLIIQALFNEQTCVQGLSGTNFALKVFVLLSTFSLPIPILCFELAETLVLIEKRTFYWHFSGLCLSGVCLLLYMTFLKPSKFPGRGQVLLETKRQVGIFSTRIVQGIF